MTEPAGGAQSVDSVDSLAQALAGLEQSLGGAQAMAANGADFAEILVHYYPGTQLTRMDKTGFSGS